jgi:hypothetical protein
LRIEEALAFGGRGQFFQRGEIDRAERFDLGRQAARFRLAGRCP